MEDVLAVDQRPYDPTRPVVCLDEQSKQLIRETRTPVPATSGRPERVDSEYERNGTANLFLAFEPLAGRRRVTVTDRRTKVDFARVVRALVDEQYPQAETVVLVMDNPNTHKPSSRYEAFAPAEARRLIERLEVRHTPKHGSWLNVAETELSVLSRQCLNRRIGEKADLRSAVAAWEKSRNTAKCRVDWQFTTADARVKLKRLYPSIRTG
jgi:DDE superfamily endonuclease